ncbi:hypothetical protein [Parasphingopyxis sp.]|uniref:hypothetical protein n=1 Tax=Parasphingopyxis sp. TaxID=1920299 RepID=UPI0026176347|nr:hypothetical protein [Parasphingopyxis sp.]
MAALTKQFLALLGAMLLSVPASAQLSSENFEFKQISSGENRPGISLDALTQDIILALYSGDTLADLANRGEHNRADIDARVEVLVAEGLATEQPDASLSLAFPVMTLAETPQSMPVSPALIDDSVALIVAHLPEVRTAYAQLAGFEHVSFEESSLLILSNVLLDNWQINGIEADILGTERPSRGGGNYYLALMEKSGPEEEAFGIYGNHFTLLDGLALGLYGNRRYSGPANIITLPDTETLTARLGPDADVSSAAVRQRLAETLRALHRDPAHEAAAGEIALLRQFGLIDADNRVLIPIFGMATYEALSDMANAFRPELAALLQAHLPELRSHYERSPYATHGVSFEEYFIWWYHLYYSRVTDALAERGEIRIPAAVNTTYLGVLAE